VQTLTLAADSVADTLVDPTVRLRLPRNHADLSHGLSGPPTVRAGSVTGSCGALPHKTKTASTAKACSV